jgi:CRISPR-associated exonuclease Cas4
MVAFIIIFMEAVESIKDKNSDFRVNGTLIHYLVVCEREAWFYLDGVRGNQGNRHIVEGNLKDKSTYSDKEKIYVDNNIVMDFVEGGGIVEIKNSSKLEESSRLQIGFYMWYMEYFHDVRLIGEIVYPSENSRVEVCLDEDLRSSVLDKVERAFELYKMESPPGNMDKEWCEECAYFDICKV